MTKSVWFWMFAVLVPTALLVNALDAWIGLPYGIELLIVGVGVGICLELSHRHSGIPG